SHPNGAIGGDDCPRIVTPPRESRLVGVISREAILRGKALSGNLYRRRCRSGLDRQEGGAGIIIRSHQHEDDGAAALRIYSNCRAKQVVAVDLQITLAEDGRSQRSVAKTWRKNEVSPTDTQLAGVATHRGGAYFILSPSL